MSDPKKKKKNLGNGKNMAQQYGFTDFGSCLPLWRLGLMLGLYSRNKESLASEVMQFSDGRLHCDIRFCHPLQDWEEASVDLF